MADSKVSALTATTSLADTDEVYVVDGGVSKRIVASDLGVSLLANAGVTSSVAELNILDGVTADATELNYVEGVTSSIQDQFDALKTKIVDLGDWNMDADATTIVPHGLSLSKIRGIKVTIRNDADNLVYDFAGTMEANPGGDADVNTGTVNINIRRQVAGIFNSPDFSATSFNRGWVLIQHVP